MRGRGCSAATALLASLLATLLTQAPAQALAAGDDDRRCRTYDHLAIDCNDARLREVPQHLPTNVRILHMSQNHIREVRAGAFDRYTALEELYMDENGMLKLDDNALRPLQNLRMLSIALNSFTNVPSSLLQLPALTWLVLGHNPMLSLESLTAALEAAPADGALRTLSLVDCQLTALPPLHRLPRLRFLNVSGNPFVQLRAAQLAPLCSLRKLGLEAAHATMTFCDCELLVEWSAKQSLDVTPKEALRCAGRKGEAEGAQGRCANGTDAREAEALRAECGVTLAGLESQQQRRRLWKWVGGSVGALAVLLLLVALCMWCRRRDSKAAARKASARKISATRNKLNDDDDDLDTPINLRKK